MSDSNENCGDEGLSQEDAKNIDSHENETKRDAEEHALVDFQYVYVGSGRSNIFGFNSALDIKMSPMRFVYVDSVCLTQVRKDEWEEERERWMRVPMKTSVFKINQ